MYKLQVVRGSERSVRGVVDARRVQAGEVSGMGEKASQRDWMKHRGSMTA